MNDVTCSTLSKPRLASVVATLALLVACNGSARHSPQAADSDGASSNGSTGAEPSTTVGGSGGSGPTSDSSTTPSDASTATSAAGGASSGGANGAGGGTLDAGASVDGSTQGGSAQGGSTDGASQGATGGGASPGGAGGTRTNSGGAGGSAGGDPDTEVAACVTPQAIDRLRIYYSDRTLGVCAMIVFQQGQVCGSTSVDSSGGGWCYEGTVLSADVDACSARMNPTDPVDETQASGTLTASGDVVDIDIQLTFPEDTDLPQELHVVVENCTADCGPGDCR